MKKAIGLVVLCLVVSVSWALATELMESVPLNKTLPVRVDRSGSCAVTSVPDTANTISLWNSATWLMGSAHGMYIDPESEDTTEGCVAPFYPFHATSIDFLFVPYNDDTMEVGLTATYDVQFTCPKDYSSGSVTEDCQGPGEVFAAYTLSLTMAREHYDADGIGLLFWVNLPVDVCVNRPFFLTARLTGWTGGPTTFAPQIIWHRQGAALEQAGKRCDNWLSLPAVGYTCWLLDGYDIGYGCGADPVPPGFPACFPGSAFMFVNGDAGAECTPSACAPLPNNYPGDDASNPLIVDATPWEAVINLCDYTSDYNYYDDALAAPTTTRRFTGRGNDVVLQIAFDPLLPEVCFAVTLTPQCAPPDILRLRTWITDSFGPLYWGNPQYPATGPQTYNFTAAGLGCQLPDAYLLYVDGYPCCCPLLVTYGGDQPLPVELTSFDAVAGNGQVTLTWVTASERDMDFFQISRDGEVLAEVTATNAPSGHTYTYVDHNVVNGTAYDYQLAAHDLNGAVTVWPEIESATPMAPMVTEYALNQNFPNPFNPTTSIAYAVKDAGLVTLKVYTVDGRAVATLVNDVQESGTYTITFDGSDLASGVYMYTLEVNGFSATNKMVLMK